MLRLAAAGIASLVLLFPASAQAPVDTANPSLTDCAAIFSLVAASEREDAGRGSEREIAALKLYSKAVRRLVVNGEAATLAEARDRAAARSRELLQLMDTDAGAEAINTAAGACLRG